MAELVAELGGWARGYVADLASLGQVRELAAGVLLLPLLTASAPSRVVNLGSLGQVPFDPADAGFEHGYSGVDAYRRSKLALAAFSFDLAGQLEAQGVTVNCLHPATFMDTAMVTQGGITPVSTVEQGGEATMALITDPALDTVTGQFFHGLETSRALPRPTTSGSAPNSARSPTGSSARPP